MYLEGYIINSWKKRFLYFTEKKKLSIHNDEKKETLAYLRMPIYSQVADFI